MYKAQIVIKFYFSYFVKILTKLITEKFHLKFRKNILSEVTYWYVRFCTPLSSVVEA